MKSAPLPPEIVIIDDDVQRGQWVRESRAFARHETVVIRWGPEVRPLVRLLAPRLVVAGAAGGDEHAKQILRALRDDGLVDPILVLGTGFDEHHAAAWRASGVTECIDVSNARNFDQHLARYARTDVVAAPNPDDARRFVHLESAVVDLDELCVVREGKRVRLSPTEFALFTALLRREGRVVSRDVLRDEVWAGRPLASRVVDRHIASLRRHLERDPRRPTHVQTVFGDGYVLKGISPRN